MYPCSTIPYVPADSDDSEAQLYDVGVGLMVTGSVHRVKNTKHVIKCRAALLYLILHDVGRASGEPGPQQRMFYILRHVLLCQQSKQESLAETYNIGDEFYLFLQF